MYFAVYILLQTITISMPKTFNLRMRNLLIDYVPLKSEHTEFCEFQLGYGINASSLPIHETACVLGAFPQE